MPTLSVLLAPPDSQRRTDWVRPVRQQARTGERDTDSQGDTLANIQRYFSKFHDAIKLGRFKEEQTLREKRDIIRGKLRDLLPDVFAAHSEDTALPVFRDQGSYDLRTGIKPLDSDYDIDQGLYFQAGSDTYPDPVVLKQRIREALDGHTDEVRVREPCVTVFYHSDGEPIYQVDLAIYSDGALYADGKPRLARGRAHSIEENRRWEISDPQGLVAAIDGRFADSDREQFQRVVRYLKRWKDIAFPCDGHAAPRGIALTAAAYHWLTPQYNEDEFDRTPDDLAALRHLVRCMLDNFMDRWHEREAAVGRRFSARLPAEPYSDPFEKMSNKQMEDFERRLQRLHDALVAAGDAVDPIAACESLQKVFGSDFPVPAREETAKRHVPAIVSSSNSAQGARAHR